MNKKIFWGGILILFGLFYTLQQYIPENLLRYFLNYQFMLILIGLGFLISKKRTKGTILVIVGLYLYLSEFFYEYFEKIFPIGILLTGTALVFIGMKERKKQNNKTEFVFSSKKKSKNFELDDAEEIK